MSGYVKSWTFSTEFDGDAVSIRLKPLSRIDALRIAGMDAGDPELQSRVIEFYGTVLRENVESIEGLRDAAGSPIDLDTLLREAYFTRLIVEIGSELVTKSHPANPVLPGSQLVTALPGGGNEPATT